MTTPYAQVRDINGFANGDAGLPVADHTYIALMQLGVPLPVTVPGTATHWVARVEYDRRRDVLLAINDIAALPVAGAFVPTTSFMMPHLVRVKKGDVLSIVANLNNLCVGISFYALP